jgi:hypothetical protein
MTFSGLLPQSASKLSLPEFILNINRGREPGWSLVLFYGSNLAVTTTEADLWRQGEPMTFPAVAGVMTIVSTSAEDAPGGDGIGVVLVTGLDANFNVVQEPVVLAGLTPVVTTTSFLRFHSAQGIASGSAEENVGNITGTIGGDPVMLIAATDTQSLQFTYTVPAGHMLYVQQANVWQGRDNAVSTSLKIRPEGLPWFRLGSNEVYRTGLQADLFSVAVGEKTDIRVTAKQITGGGSTAVFSAVSAIMENCSVTENSVYQPTP